MKLDKLRLLRDELQGELSPDGIDFAVYYFFGEKWNQLDVPSSLSEAIITCLGRSMSESVAFHAPSSRTAWYACNDIECGISLSFPTSPQIQKRKKYRDRIANVVQRASNSYQVAHNPLTLLLARDAFREKLSAALASITVSAPGSAETQESGRDKVLAVFAIDIDHFKQVNDTHGHLYGDQVLKAFAVRLENAAEEILQTAAASVAIDIGHPSGEEFLISIYGDASRDQILDWANSFRAKIGDEPLPSGSEWARLGAMENLGPILLPPLHERTVTASVGIAVRGGAAVDGSAQDRIAAILDNADTALYRAKAAGRNQVIAFDDILSTCGRVLEHDTTTRIVAIDIGKNVGVLLGQEFRVFAPGYTGNRKFTVNDGRTTRTIGNYPRVELTTITVFDVQPELSFAYISDTEDHTTKIEVGAHLEAIPTGSISHLLTGVSRYFPTAMENVKVGDSTAVQEFIKSNANTGNKPFAVVFRFASEQDYLKRYGSAALNAALARLFREAINTFYSASATGILDPSSVCIVGRGVSYNETAVVAFADKIKDEFAELRPVVGIFCDDDIERPSKGDNSKLEPLHAIEFARFAASDHAAEANSRTIHFEFATARRILSSLLESKAYKQGIADFEKLTSLGVESATLQNFGGLLNSRMGFHRQAADLFEAASKRFPDQSVYKTNFGTAAYQLSEVERALRTLNTISLGDLDKIKTSHPYGYVTYARLLAQAKLAGLATFDPERFSLIAVDALNREGYKDSPESVVIATVLNQLQA